MPGSFKDNNKLDYIICRLKGLYKTIERTRVCRHFFQHNDDKTEFQSERFIQFLMVIGTLILFSLFAYRYYYCSSMADLPIFIEAMDSAASGNLFHNSLQYFNFHTVKDYVSASNSTVSMFSVHFRPSLFLFVPFYKLLPTPLTLFFLYTLILTSSVWPLYKISERFIASKEKATIVAICYCLNPSVIYITKSFFPGSLAAPLMVWAIWLFISHRMFSMSVLLMLILGLKEIMALPVTIFGVYLAIFHKKWCLGCLIATLSTLYLFVCIHKIIPSVSPNLVYLSVPMLYPHFGSSLLEIAKTILLKPWKMIPFLLTPEAAKYLFKLLLPVAFIPLLRLKVFILATPVFLQNLLTGVPGYNWYKNPFGHWSAPVIPFIYLALLHYLKDNKNKKKVIERALLCVTACALVASILQTGGLLKTHNEVKLAIDNFKKIAPKHSTVTSNVLPGWGHLVSDYQLRLFPKDISSAEYIFILSDPKLYRISASGYDIGHGLTKNEMAVLDTKHYDYILIASSLYQSLNESKVYKKVWEKSLTRSKLHASVFKRKELFHSYGIGKSDKEDQCFIIKMGK